MNVLMNFNIICIDCPPIFNPVRAVTVSIGATPQSFTTDKECSDACLANQNCFSYQLDRTVGSTNLCWFQFVASNLPNTRNAPGIIEFIKNTTYCTLTTTTTQSSLY